MASPNRRLATRKQAEEFFDSIAQDDVATLDRILQPDLSMLKWERPDGKSPLHLAAEAGSLKVARYLMDEWHYSPHITLGGKEFGNYDPAFEWSAHTPLHFAAEAGKLRMVRLLLERGAKVNAGKGHHDTPLHRAVLANRKNVVEFLLQHGARVDLKQNKGSRIRG